MQVEEWEEIKRIFESALNFAGAERARFLDAACHDRPVLLQTVGELLRAHDEASGFLDDESGETQPVFGEGDLVGGRFRIIRLISRGGMGEVYETYDERLSIRLALKTLRPEYASDEQAIERFRREIRVTREVAHPNLCRVYELVEHQPLTEKGSVKGGVITCLTMQLMSGETLQQYLKRTGVLSPEAALPLIRQIAGAVAMLHDNGIIHRDLKPSNIMIVEGQDREPRAVVMDFGLSKPFSADGDLFESRSDFRAGAPFYLAPELVRGEKPSVASDIYAFGLIIDEMVTGGGAFSGDTVEAVLYQKLWSEPKDPSTRKVDLPHAWCRVIRRCLHREPSKRFRSVHEAIETLNPLQAVSNTRPLPFFYRFQRALHPGVSGTRRSLQRPRSRRLIPVLLGLLVVAGGALGYIGSRPITASVLIFEFENLTGQPKNDYLSRGTTWEVERLLYDIPGVTVSSFHGPRPKGLGIRQEARFAIDGYVQADKTITRLLVRVTENSSGRIVWMNKYDTTAMNSLTMQSDIAAGAVTAMRDRVLAPQEPTRFAFVPRPTILLLWLHKLPFFKPVIGGPPTESQEAMEAYTRGRALWEERSITSDRAAIEEYQRALKLDSRFALAEADLAGVYLSLLQLNVAPRVSMLEAAREHADQAVRLGPEYAQSYTSLAAVQQASWDWKGAEESYRKAISINPKLPRAHRWFGGLLIQFGRFDEGLQETRLAVSLDPYDYSLNLSLATYLLYSGRLGDAAAQIESSLAQRNLAWGHHNLAYVYARQSLLAAGDRKQELAQKALAEADKATSLDGPELTTALYALVYAVKGDRMKANEYLSKLLNASSSGSVNPMDLVQVYSALGERNNALKILSDLVEKKDPGAIYMKVDPFLDPLRQTEQFTRLLSRTGL